MRRIIDALLRRLVVAGRVEVTYADGTRIAYGTGHGPSVAVRFADRTTEWRLVLNPELALGEAYMDGRLIVESGSLFDLLTLVQPEERSVRVPGLIQLRRDVRTLRRRWDQYNPMRRARRNVSHHYDLDSRLYGLFLDSDRQYSCAYFERPGVSLDDAQLAKKRHVAAKLLIEPGHRVLDIGSGWGGLAIYLAQYCRSRVVGITLSPEQLEFSTRRAQELEMTDQVEFRLQDYRAVDERFDRIVSIGMFEHVGVSHYLAFFRQVARLLADGGIMILHSIGRFSPPGATNPWVDRYIFPGGYIPALSEVLAAAEKSGLIVTDIEILRLHYAETLRAWRERFLARIHEAQEMFGERFCRMWEFYLAGAECAFRNQGFMVFQIQITRRQDAVPLTRDYVGQAEQDLRTRENSGRPRVRLAGE